MFRKIIVAFMLLLMAGANVFASDSDVISGVTTGTGSVINVSVGFKPSAVLLYDSSGALGYWNSSMTSGTLQRSPQNRNQCFTSAGLTVAGSTDSTGVLIANTVTYTIDGTLYSRTTINVALDTTCNITYSTATARERVVLITLGASGDSSIVVSPVADGAGNAVVPACPVGRAPVGYVRILTDTTASFTGGTTKLDAATVTDTYTNVSNLGGSIISGGISQYAGSTTTGQGFTIGTSTLINKSGVPIFYTCFR